MAVLLSSAKTLVSKRSREDEIIFISILVHGSLTCVAASLCTHSRMHDENNRTANSLTRVRLTCLLAHGSVLH